MAIEGTETVVEQPGSGSSTTEQKPAGTTDNSQKTDPNLSAKPAAAGASRDYDKEINGLKAEIQKERKARQAEVTRAKQYETDLAAERKRIQALVGATPKSETEENDEQIRQRFNALYPHLGGLTKEDIEAIRELKTQRNELKETTNHYWTTHSKTMVDGVQAELEKELGGKLSERQRQQVERSYALAAEGNEEFLERHANGDKTLISEFAKQFIEDWFEPARRKVTRDETQRFRAVPSGKGQGIVTHGEKKIDVNDPKAVEDLLVKGFRERNGEFGRR